MLAFALALQVNSQIPLLARSVAPATNSKFGARAAQDQMRQNVRTGRLHGRLIAAMRSD